MRLAVVLISFFSFAQCALPPEVLERLFKTCTHPTAEQINKVTQQFLRHWVHRGEPIDNDNAKDRNVVISGFSLFHLLIDLIRVGSDDTRRELKAYLGLESNDAFCDLHYCKLFEKQINMMKDKELGIDFKSVLFYNEHKTLGDRLNHCSDIIVPIDFRDSVQAKSNINKKIEEILPSAPKKDWLKESQQDFLSWSGLTIDPEIFGRYRRVKLRESKQFLTLRRAKYGITPYYRRDDAQISMFNTDIGLSEGKSATVYTDDIGDSKFMLFITTAMDDDDLTRRLDFQSIIENLSKYVDLTLTGTATRIRSLSIPAIKIDAAVDLKPKLTMYSSKVFEDDNIKLYTTPDTMYEFRHPEKFEVKSYFQDTVSGEADDAEQDRYLDSAFIFAFVDKKSKIILKAGIYAGIS